MDAEMSCRPVLDRTVLHPAPSAQYHCLALIQIPANSSRLSPRPFPLEIPVLLLFLRDWTSCRQEPSSRTITIVLHSEAQQITNRNTPQILALQTDTVSPRDSSLV